MNTRIFQRGNQIIVRIHNETKVPGSELRPDETPEALAERHDAVIAASPFYREYVFTLSAKPIVPEIAGETAEQFKIRARAAFNESPEDFEARRAALIQNAYREAALLYYAEFSPLADDVEIAL